MGNWRTVKIIGTMSSEDASKVKAYLANDDNFECLHNGGICGLPNWGKTSFDFVGNLAERGYDEDSIADELRNIHSFAPSLEMTVHLGDDNEETNCVKSIVLNDGEVSIVEPLIDDVGKISQAQMQQALFAQMNRW